MNRRQLLAAAGGVIAGLLLWPWRAFGRESTRVKGYLLGTTLLASDCGKIPIGKFKPVYLVNGPGIPGGCMTLNEWKAWKGIK